MMHRCLRLSLLLVTIGLAGCATWPGTRSQPAPQQPVAVASQPPSATPQPPAPPPAPPGEPAVPPLSLSAPPTFTQTGLASFYGPRHDGKRTARGDSFDHHEFTAAHRTLAFGTMVRVTNLANGRAVMVEIADRGPHIKGRVIDISLAAAREIGMQQKGVARVKLEAFESDPTGRN